MSFKTNLSEPCSCRHWLTHAVPFSDDVALPEPKISIDPGYANRTYAQGQQIAVKCAVESQKPLNVVLTIGNTRVGSNPMFLTFLLY